MRLCSETIPDKLGNYLMRIHVEEDDGTVIEKDVPMDVYLKILGDASLSNMADLIQMPVLPEHYLTGKISSSKDTFSVILFYPEEKRAIKFAEKHWYVPFPALVFRFVVKSGIVQAKSCFASSGAIDDDAILFSYPFGNVNSESGNICMGTIKGRHVQTMSDINIIVEDFFMSETNNDYYADNNATSYRQEELLSRLEKMEHFPVEWLKDSGITLGNIK